MHDPINDIDWILVGRGARGFEATTLVNGNIDQCCTRLHFGQLGA